MRRRMHRQLGICIAPQRREHLPRRGRQQNDSRLAALAEHRRLPRLVTGREIAPAQAADFRNTQPTAIQPVRSTRFRRTGSCRIIRSASPSAMMRSASVFLIGGTFTAAPMLNRRKPTSWAKANRLLSAAAVSATVADDLADWRRIPAARPSALRRAACRHERGNAQLRAHSSVACSGWTTERATAGSSARRRQPATAAKVQLAR